MDKSILLSAKDIAFISKGRTILEGVNLDLHEAEIPPTFSPELPNLDDLFAEPPQVIAPAAPETPDLPDLDDLF